MDRKDVERVATFLADDYPFPIKVVEKSCPICFTKGKTRTIKIKRDSTLDSPTSRDIARGERYEAWMELFIDTGLCPIQTLNVYIPSLKENGRVVRFPSFTHPLILMGDHCSPCAPACHPMCLLCSTPLDQEPTLLIDPWPPRVHQVCCKPYGLPLRGAAKGDSCTTADSPNLTP